MQCEFENNVTQTFLCGCLLQCCYSRCLFAKKKNIEIEKGYHSHSERLVSEYDTSCFDEGGMLLRVVNGDLPNWGKM